MLILRRSHERGNADYGWLRTYYTFSFADYRDPDWMGYGPLRVINEDRIAEKRGFDPHGHRDMEILTYVVRGSLQHHDDLGNGSVIRPNHLQYLSAGTGVFHSEVNPTNAPTHLLQIWIMPNALRQTPRYDQRDFGEPRLGVLQLLASGDGRNGSIIIRQKADLYRGMYKEGQTIEIPAVARRKRWLQVISGDVAMGRLVLHQGDACGFDGEAKVKLVATSLAHVLLFDLP